MAITGYFIASATTPGDLTTTVNKYIALGWQPSGPVVRRDGNADICQAMIQGSADSGTSSYTLPAATTTTLGGVIVGDGLGVDSKGTLAANVTEVNGKIGDITLTADDVGALASVPAATAADLGGVKMAANIAALTAAPTETDFNKLLTALQTAGMMATS